MKRALFVLILCVVLFGVSCKKAEVAPTSEPVKVETHEPVVETQEPETTEPVLSSHPLFESKRPITFMVNNAKEARPQTGWKLAKVIYEANIEAKQTRYMFVTEADEGVIGPIRSARPAFFYLASGYRSIYGHCGNYAYVKNSGVERFITDWDEFYHPGYYRSKDRYAPHNLYAMVDKVYEAVKEKGIDTEISDSAKESFKVYDAVKEYTGGEKAESIHFSYDGKSQIEYRYDPEKKVYVKYIDDILQVDKETEEVVEFSNLFIIPRVQTKMPNGIHEKILYQGIDQPMDYYVQGQRFKASYDKVTEDAPFQFKLDGEELILNPGLTMINIVPVELPIEVK
ncbi:DUF3048 domain-containing protein [Guggenheimella bovis]